MPFEDTNRRSVLKTVAGGSIVFLAGCTGSDPPASDGDDDDAGDGQGHFIWAQGSEAPNYNVFRVTDTTSGERISRVLDPAYTFNEDNEIVPRLVRDYEVNDDFTEFEFTITEHGEWSDPYGEMTAEDWVYSITEIIQGEDNWAGVSMVDDWRTTPEGEEEPVYYDVEQTGDYSFSVSLPEPDPAFLDKPIMWGFQEVVPKELAEPYVEEQDGDGLNEDDEIQNLSYTGNLGAFSVEVIETEARMYATRNDDYYLRNYDGYEDAPYMDEFTFQVLREESTRLSALEAGDVTYVRIPSRTVDEFEDNDETNVFRAPTPYCSSIMYNMREDGWEGLNEAAIRRGLTMAVDRESILEDIYDGVGEVADTFQPTLSEFYDTSEVTQIEYDPDAAQELIEDNLPSGHAFEDGRLVDGDGEEVVLNFVYSDASEAVDLVARYVQQEYDEIGIEVELDPVPWNTMLEDYLDAPPGEANEHDLIGGIGLNTYPRSPEATEVFWNPETNVGYGGYDDPHDVTGMLRRASTMTDADERQEVLAEVFGILSEEQPYNFLMFSEDLETYRTHVEPTEEPSLSWTYDMNRWQIAEEQ